MTPPPTLDQIVRHLRHTHEVARQAVAAGRHPFGAVLVAPDHETVLLTQGNLGSVNHAESTLARRAARRFAPDLLWRSTLYTNVEPCCMCAGTVYWAHIGRVVFGMTEHALLGATGDHAENPTLDLPCRDVFARGQKAVEVIGPVPEVADEALAQQRAFWASR